MKIVWRDEGSVGGTPTAAVGTTALPKQLFFWLA
jgi:hypothetical protein